MTDPTVHLLRTTGGSQCGRGGFADADINSVTCPTCSEEHEALTGAASAFHDLAAIQAVLDGEEDPPVEDGEVSERVLELRTRALRAEEQVRHLSALRGIDAAETSRLREREARLRRLLVRLCGHVVQDHPDGSPSWEPTDHEEIAAMVERADKLLEDAADIEVAAQKAAAWDRASGSDAQMQHEGRLSRICRILRLSEEGASLTFRGLWDLDAEGRRVHFGVGLDSRFGVAVKGLQGLDPYAPGAVQAASCLILAHLEKLREERGVAGGR